MRIFTVNYLAEDGSARRGAVLNRGVFVHHVPRLILLCRLFGHRPVVDGTDIGDSLHGPRGHRWVCCDRCGVRAEPQGQLDPATPIGQRYTGPWAEALPEDPKERRLALVQHKEQHQGVSVHRPGPLSTSPTSTVGGQVVIGGKGRGLSVQFTIGCAGEENTLAGHVSLGRLGALYLHTDRHGTWLQRRLNATGYVNRTTSLRVGDGRLSWQAWANQDHWSRSTPRWRDGSLRIDPRDLLLGEKRFNYDSHGEPVAGVVRMPHGDDHPVTLQLQRQTHGRHRGRKKLSWVVDWQCKPGIPTKPGDRGWILGSGVPVPDRAVAQGTWPMEAAAGIAEWATKERTRYGFTPLEPDEVVV